MGVAQPLAFTPVGPPLVLPDVEVGLVPGEAQVVSEVGGVVGLSDRGRRDDAGEQVRQRGRGLAGQRRLRLVELAHLLAAPCGFEEGGAALPASASQHEVLWGPGPVALLPRTRHLPWVDAVDAGG